MNAIRSLAVAVLAAGAVAGCGGDDPQTAAVSTPPPVETATAPPAAAVATTTAAPATGTATPPPAAAETTTPAPAATEPPAAAPAETEVPPPPTATPAPKQPKAKVSNEPPLVCLRRARLKAPGERGPGLWAGKAANGEDVVVDGPYIAAKLRDESIATLAGLSVAEPGGRYVVTSALTAGVEAEVKRVATCLKNR